MTNVFIDGSAGTTGLKIYERLGNRNDIKLITLSDSVRKDPKARKEALNSSDVAFLCLPDAAAKEAVSMLYNPETVIIDTSTAHRTSPDWVYGFPELTGQREKIAASKRIANPGCHASGFISLIAPLTENGIISKSEKLTCFSITGYSGGGKKMIADYEANGNTEALKAPRMYGLGQQHKHLTEMAVICGLENPPLFSPVVSSFYSGMEVVVQLFSSQINGDIKTISDIYNEYYDGKIIRFSQSDENGFLSSAILTGQDGMEISVYGNEERITLVSRFDNLGKGACGAAIQNMNIVLGKDESFGLILEEKKK